VLKATRRVVLFVRLSQPRFLPLSPSPPILLLAFLELLNEGLLSLSPCGPAKFGYIV